MTTIFTRAALAAAMAAASSTAFAAPFTAIRIGDIDGFGFTTDVPGLVAANGSPADTNGNGRLEQTEFLPDLNGDGGTLTGSNDDFNNRSVAEAGGAFVTGAGFTDTGSTGSQYTDISLSTSYDASVSAGTLYTSPGAAGAGAFPMPPSTSLSNQPGFEFRFDVAKADINPAQSIFFNILFGDYDVTPANVTITRADGSTEVFGLSTQPSADDGLIQATFATLTFADVFSDGGAVWNGYLDVDFVAPAEPFTAFDFVELSTRPIPSNVPEPLTLGLFVGGLLGAAAARRRRR